MGREWVRHWPWHDPAMTVRLSDRGNVEPFYAMELLKLANHRRAAGADVISLCLGQPTDGAPAPVREAAVTALESGSPLGYTDADGLPVLKKAIAAHYAGEYGVQVDPGRVLVTTGSSAAFTAVILAAFDEGEVVAMARPGYPAYRNVLGSLGCRVVDLDCGPADRFQPTVEHLEALPEPPAGLIIASPSNPTGTIIEPARLAEIAGWCQAHGTLLISDEIYHGISFGERTASVLESSSAQVAVGSFSKYFCMTGWRVGWLVVPEALARRVELLLGNLNLSTPTLSQLAAVAAFGPRSRRELDGHVVRYRDNRDLVLRRLPEVGVEQVVVPDGAFYVYPDVAHLTDDSLAWCLRALDEIGVTLTPGIDFAPVRPGRRHPADGSRYVRISTAGSTAEIDEAFNRLARWV